MSSSKAKRRYLAKITKSQESFFTVGYSQYHIAVAGGSLSDPVAIAPGTDPINNVAGSRETFFDFHLI